MLLLPQRYKFSSKSQLMEQRSISKNSCCCYRKGTNFQANHNHALSGQSRCRVVVATAKVQIFKQITTIWRTTAMRWTLLLLPQRYKFSSKSQRRLVDIAQEWGCCCYRKGTNFQANHNGTGYLILPLLLLLLPQRYKSSSKSQQTTLSLCPFDCCCCYRKGTNFQANHNCRTSAIVWERVVVATAKVQIFKQITTAKKRFLHSCSCCCYRKGTNFQANHNTPDTRPRRPRVVVATAKVQIFKQITTFILLSK